ncbi:MAG: PAS domain S-box protein [Ardenticatenaceae bacterium]|nr:PAS domain S-box protein [Ardenticatenaceae bacterium]
MLCIVVAVSSTHLVSSAKLPAASKPRPNWKILKECCAWFGQHSPGCFLGKIVQSVYRAATRPFADDANFAGSWMLIGLTDFDMPWAKDQARFYREIDQQVMGNDTPQYNIEESQTHADGELIWVRTNKIPLHNNEGNVVGILGMYEDITGLKQAEESLRRSEEMYRHIVDTAEEGIWLLDENGFTTFVNNKMAEMLQYDPKDMLGQHLFDFMDEPGRTLAARNLQRRQQGVREQHDFRFLRKDGSELWTIISTSPILDDDGRYAGALGMLTDITERQRVQKELEGYTRRLEMLRNVEHAILEARSTEAIAMELLHRLQGTLPFSRGSVVLIDWETEILRVLASLSLIDTQITKGMQRPLADFGFNDEIKSGQPFYQSDLTELKRPPAVVQKLMDEGVRCIMAVPFVLQGIVTGVFYLGANEPHSFTAEHMEIARELSYSLAVAIQQAQFVEQIQQQAQELERRVANRTRDLQEANERLKDLDRLKSKFVSDITHELRTPVTNMLLYLDLMRLGKPERQEHYQGILQEQAQRLRQLVEDSMDLSRLDLSSGDVKFLPLDLNTIVAQAVSVFEKKAEEKGLGLTFTPQENLPNVPVDGGQISRILGNLLKNAVYFTPTGQIQVVTLTDDTAEFAGIRVQDTGIGFTEEDKKHCFVPFYRGERVGQLNIPGNGLGLALVKQIVELHNGRIQIESVIDQGSTITVWLPLNRPGL